MSWEGIALKVLPFAGRLAKRWWRKRDLARNLSAAVIAALDARQALAPGIRDELVAQWLYVRDDPEATRLVRGLLDSRTSDQEERLRRRIGELLSDLDLKLGVDKATELLTRTILENLAEAQPTPEQRYRADVTNVTRKLDASAQTEKDILALLSERSRAPTRSGPKEVEPLIAAPYQLPRDISDFTNREDERDALTRAFSGSGRRAPLVAIVSGKPGVGKSALAIRVAHLVAKDYPDAQLYADLGNGPVARTPSDVLGDFLGALGAEGIPAELSQRKALFRHMSKGRRLLLVIDNAVREEDVRVLIPSQGESAVVVTSRSPLGGLEDVGLKCLLDVLSDNASRELLVGELRDENRISEEPAAVQAIVSLCGRLPLALRIAGAKLRARPQWSLAGFADRLADEHRRLDELTAGDREVRASFALSYDDLDPGAARLFRLLGLLRGPNFDAPVAAALLGGSECDSRELLEALTDSALVDVIDDQRYAFHDLIRIFARDRLDTEEEPTAIEAGVDGLLDWWLDRVDLVPDATEGDEVDSAEPGDPAETFAWLESERPNLMAAIGLAHEHERWFPTWALAMGLSAFYERRGHWEEWRRTHELALDAVRQITVASDDFDAPNPREMEAMVLSRLGLVYLAEQRTDEAIACYESALQIASELSDRRAEISELNSLGTAYSQAGRIDDAISHFERSLAFAREANDRGGEASTLNNLGLAYKDEGRSDDATACLRRSLELKRDLGDKLGEARTLANLGNLAHHEGKWDEANGLYVSSIALYRAASDRHGAAMSEMDLAAIQSDRGDWQAARKRFEHVLQTFTEIGDRRRVGWVQVKLSAIAKAQGDVAGAISHAETALELFQQLGVPNGEAEALNALAVNYMWQGDLAKAIEFYSLNLATYRDLGDRRGEAGTLGNLGTAYAFAGATEEAAASYEESIRLFRDLAEPHGEAISRNSFGKLLAASGELEAAEGNFQYSLEVFRRTGSRPAQALVLGNLAELRAEVGDWSAATELYESALAIQRELGDQRGEAELLVPLGAVIAAKGNPTAAADIWKQALAIPDGLTKDEADAVRAQLWS